MEKQTTIFSFFSGAGFLDLGFEIAGFKIAYVNEVFEPFMDAYRHARHCLNLPSPEYGYYLGNAIDFTEGDQKPTLKELVRTWFKNAMLMPAVIEIEHSTGVTSGLTRMKGFQDLLPPFPTRYVVVAPDESRDKVVREANRIQFRSLDARFFPYSSVEELYALCQRRKIRGVGEEFLDCYMEPIVQPA